MHAKAPNKDTLTRLLLIILILLTLCSIFLNFFHRSDAFNVDSIINQRISEIKLPIPTNGKDAEVDYKSIQEYINSRIPAPITGPRGLQGLQGIPGISIKGNDGSSCSAQQLEHGAAITCDNGSSALIHDGANGQPGVDGKDAYIELRCNENKNRWEVRYIPDGTWSILNNKSTKCTATLNKE